MYVDGSKKYIYIYFFFQQVTIPTGNAEVLTDTNACLDVGTTLDSLVVRLCSNAQYCDENTCIRKCCDEDEAWIGHSCEKLQLNDEKSSNFQYELMDYIDKTPTNASDVLKNYSSLYIIIFLILKILRKLKIFFFFRLWAISW